MPKAPKLHLAFIGFDVKRGMQEGRGFAALLVPAESPDQALPRFQALLKKQRRKDSLLLDTQEVFFESGVEISGVPEGGFVAFEGSWFGPDEGALFNVMPFPDSVDADSYAYDDLPGDPAERAQAEEDGYSPVPFLVFPKAVRAKKKPSKKPAARRQPAKKAPKK